MSTHAGAARHVGLWPDATGHFGPYGGKYVPETLMEPLHELELAYQAARRDPGFDAELRRLLRDYVGRPTPLSLAARLSERLGCRVYLKREDLCHTGAHKINNALGQALLVKRMGKTRVVAETGAGQHGVATATVCALLGLECVVYMGTDDMARQSPNVARMRLLGAEVRGVDSGTRTLKDAINEAMRDWVANVRDHALPARLGARLPSLPGHGARLPGADRAGSPRADAGGDGRPAGSPRRLRRRRLERDRALLRLSRGRGRAHGRGRGRGPLVEARGPCGEVGVRAAPPSKIGVLQGTRTYLLQDEAGNVLPTHSVSAGLDYPAVGPEHALLHDEGRVAYDSVRDDEALAAFHLLAETEGILPALESSHAVAWLLREAESLRGQTVLVNLSGRGDKDMGIVLEQGSAASMAPATPDTHAKEGE